MVRTFLIAGGLLVMSPWLIWAQPDNDNFTNRLPLSGDWNRLQSYLLDATLEPGEPLHHQWAAKSSWWTWKAAQNGRLAALLRNNSICVSGVSLYEVTSAGLLQPAPSFGGLFEVRANVEYAVAVWSQCSPWAPDLVTHDLIRLSDTGSDSFAGASRVEAVSWGVWEELITASVEPGEPIHNDLGRGPSKWWIWHPNQDGTASIQVDGSTPRAVLGAYVGNSLDSIELQSTQIRSNLWAWPAKKGQAYRIALAAQYGGTPSVHSLSATVSGLQILSPQTGTVFQDPHSVTVEFSETAEPGTRTVLWRTRTGLEGSSSAASGHVLTLTNLPRGEVELRALIEGPRGIEVSPPTSITLIRPGDLRRDPLRLVGDRVEVPIDLRGAGLEPGEPPVSGTQPASVWLEWTAPSTGTCLVQVTGSVEFARLDGDVVVPPKPPGLFPGWVEFPVIANQRYHFRLLDPAGQNQQVQLRLRNLTLPSNDARTNAIVLDGSAPGRVVGNNVFATTEADEPEQSVGRSVWYEVIPVQTAVWRLMVKSPPGEDSRYGLLRIWRQAADQTWQPYLTRRTDYFPVRIAVDAGIRYRISIEGFASDHRQDFELEYARDVEEPNDRLENASRLEGDSCVVSGVLNLATQSIPEGSPGLWWKWKAPKTGMACLSFATNSGLSYNGIRVLAFREQDPSLTPLNWMPPTPLFPEPSTGALRYLPDNRLFMTFPTVEGVEYLLLISGSTDRPDGTIAARLELSAATIRVREPQPPFQIELEGLDAQDEGNGAKVIYQGGRSFLEPLVNPPFAATFACPDCHAIRITAYLTTPSGGTRVLYSEPMPLKPAHDEPENAVVLDQWAPAIRGTSDGATYSQSDFGIRPVTDWNGPCDRGGGTVWYTWKSPITGTVTISGGGIYNPRLYVGTRRIFDPAVGQGTLQVQKGQQYRFAVQGPSNPCHAGEFGYGFSYQFTFETPQLIILQSPTPGLKVRMGDSVLLSALVPEIPADYSNLEFLIGDTFSTYPIKAVATPPFEFAWLGETPGNYTFGALIRLASGAAISRTEMRPVTVVPRNDDFAGRETLEGVQVDREVWTAPAGLEPGEVSFTGNPNARSVWWRWIAPASGEVELRILRPYNGTVYPAVFEGSQLSQLTRVSSDPAINFPPQQPNYGVSTVRFFATQGREYILRNEETGFTDSRVWLKLRLKTPPSHDHWSNAHPISGSTWTTTSSNENSTREFLEPAHGSRWGGRSVWYQWLAPANGRARLSIQGSLSAPVLAVYQGADLARAIEVAASSGAGASLEFDAVGGTLYRIAIDGDRAAVGEFQLTLNLNSPPANLQLSLFPSTPPHQLLEVTGAFGRPVTLLSSTNLVDWTDTKIGGSTSDGRVYFPFPEASEPVHQLHFFRAVAQP